MKAAEQIAVFKRAAHLADLKPADKMPDDLAFSIYRLQVFSMLDNDPLFAVAAHRESSERVRTADRQCPSTRPSESLISQLQDSKGIRVSGSYKIPI